MLKSSTGEFLDVLEASNNQLESLGSATCKLCPKRQVGLLPDPRPQLAAVMQSSGNDSSIFQKELTKILAAAATTCRPCPPNAVCPGGQVMIPRPSYWHATASTTSMQRCPNKLACQKLSTLFYPLNVSDVLRQTLELLDTFDNRTLHLASCQQAGYSNSTSGGSLCLLNVPASDPASYTQQQCAEGYTGNLCAACQSGYVLSAGFKCTRCPGYPGSGAARTILIGLAFIAGNIVIILYTATQHFKNAQLDAAPEEERKHDVPLGGLLKVFMVHVQQFIIVSQLNIDYPRIIIGVVGVVGSVTGVSSRFTYSPACLLTNQDSAGQAHLQFLGAALTPCLVVAASLVCWALRYKGCYGINLFDRWTSATTPKDGNDDKHQATTTPNIPSVQHGATLQGVSPLVSNEDTQQCTSPAQKPSIDIGVWQQLTTVLLVAVFVLYPAWAQAALSALSCYYMVGLSPETSIGYWVMNMNQRCYTGVHAELYVPIACIVVLVFGLAPPVISFLLVWKVRTNLEDPETRMLYGFIYMQYEDKFFWWDSVVQLQTYLLVAVRVFGAALLVEYQALMLLAVLILFTAINALCGPLTSIKLDHLQTLSYATTCLTVTLSMYFVHLFMDLVE
ncbi:hypothetical protein TSOC_003034 [Tetrabaena socialis]|uniref:TRP C-terminal domain-containing protein n=1 Tax=Tetrabaena socialis TaxID=47790 RepID=A0A2J8ACJ3_9CHLO|nr:hypothetical protein TSOC_003034 [Tetrabaena socialis]|eukprot:PNH10239.1 hypothetical protein TSOC_003034 [Tetrabaena socialis]